MEQTRELLMKDYDTVSSVLALIKSDDERYADLLRERDNIRNELLKCDKDIISANMENEKMKAEDRREKVKNIITISTFSAGMIYSIYALIRTFRFDEDSTVTSTLGRGILNNTIPKMFKK